MGFSFRKSKKKKTKSTKTGKINTKTEDGAKNVVDEEPVATEPQSARRKKGAPGSRGSGRVRSKEFSSPLVTIAEHHEDDDSSDSPATPGSNESRSRNVAKNGKEPGTDRTSVYEMDESLELVVKKKDTDSIGSVEIVTGGGTRIPTTADEVRDDDNEQLGEENVNPDFLEEDPYDAKAEFEADEMLDLEKLLPSDFGRQNRTDMHETNVTRKLLDAFNCGEDTTLGTGTGGGLDSNKGCINVVSEMFYDNLCGSYIGGKKRPYYNEQFTLQFLQEMTTTGVPLLNHQPPTDSDLDDWTGRSVRMYVQPGSINGTKLLQPTLEWSTLGGGWSRHGSPEVTTTTVELLSIHSIMDSTNVADEVDSDAVSDICFFSITTDTGDVHVFEAQDYNERDRIVNGLKNIIARFAYHLIAGDVQVSSELYSEESGEASGELPSLRTPSRAMNDISHSFLD